jgi:hypothetical protein
MVNITTTFLSNIRWIISYSSGIFCIVQGFWFKFCIAIVTTILEAYLASKVTGNFSDMA